MPNNILLVDFGSTYTKLTLVDLNKADVVATEISYSTVEENIKIGYHKALEKIKEKVNNNLNIKEVIACSSAAGGLKMAAIGLVPELTLEASKRTCMGAGAKVDLAFSHQLISSDIEKIIEKKIDIILLSGGTDGGHYKTILDNAKILAKANLKIPIVYAGNRSLHDEISTIFEKENINYILADNVMGELNVLNMESAKAAIREIFLKKIIEAKGIKQIEEEIDQVILPTPESVLLAAKLLSEGYEDEAGLGDLMLVDVGGATTDIYSMCDGLPTKIEIVQKGLSEPFAKRTVEGDCGMRYSAQGAIKTINEKTKKKYLNENIDLDLEAKLRKENPEILPLSEKDFLVDAIIAKACVSESTKRHVGTIEKYLTPMGVMYYQTGKDLNNIKLVIGTGGSIINSPYKWEILEEVEKKEVLDLRPIKPKYGIDNKYLFSTMGLLSIKEPLIALKILKKYLLWREDNEVKK